MAFARWTRDKRLAVADLGEVHLATFLRRRSRGPETRKKERATVRRFFAHLRRRGLLPPPISPTSPVEDLADRYIAYLRRDRGLAENSILIYAPCARAFLAHRVATAGHLAPETLDAEAIRTFLDRSAQTEVPPYGALPGRLVARGKAKPKVATAIARELAGFIWAIAQGVSPTPR